MRLSYAFADFRNIAQRAKLCKTVQNVPNSLYSFKWKTRAYLWIVEIRCWKFLTNFIPKYHCVALFHQYANLDTSFSNSQRTDQFRSPAGFSLIRTWISWKLPGSLYICSPQQKYRSFACLNLFQISTSLHVIIRPNHQYSHNYFLRLPESSPSIPWSIPWVFTQLFPERLPKYSLNVPPNIPWVFPQLFP